MREQGRPLRHLSLAVILRKATAYLARRNWAGAGTKSARISPESQTAMAASGGEEAGEPYASPALPDQPPLCPGGPIGRYGSAGSDVWRSCRLEGRQAREGPASLHLEPYDRAAVPAIDSLLPHLVVKNAEAGFLLERRRLAEEGQRGTRGWVHPNRWHERVTMKKRCYTQGPVASFERTFRAGHEIHSGTSAGSTVPAAPGSTACPRNACSSPSRSRCPRGGR